ncbi:MAG: hypothetical protein II375_07840 [Bacteroidales bacterium]|nr:hypothetical protein [Bacteroidales bacterium]
MASSEEKNAKELPIEQKLKALYDLQQVSTKIDKIRTMRGELPLEVEDLEDEVEGMHTRVSNLNEDIKKLNTLVVEYKNKIKEAEAQIKKYESQQSTVRNNREFDAISKEIEYQDLDKQFSEKKIREFTAEIHHKQELLDDTKTRIDERSHDLETKKSELDTIVAETRQEEEELEKVAQEISQGIDERSLAAFHRIRSNAHNGLAVVTIQRGACGGCFNHIPPQRQLDIRLHKKLIVCEYCGRILVDDGTQQGIDDGAISLKERGAKAQPQA